MSRTRTPPPSDDHARPSSSPCESSVRVEGERLLVAVRVTPRASHDAITCERGVLRVRLQAPPVEGAANDALVALFARTLGLPKRAITLERGAASREKLVAITHLPLDEFWRRIGL